MRLVIVYITSLSHLYRACVNVLGRSDYSFHFTSVLSDSYPIYNWMFSRESHFEHWIKKKNPRPLEELHLCNWRIYHVDIVKIFSHVGMKMVISCLNLLINILALTYRSLIHSHSQSIYVFVKSSIFSHVKFLMNFGQVLRR